MTATAELPHAGLVHLGMLYDDVDDLVARTVPEIRGVLDVGGDVHVTVDRRSARRFRKVLGADAERVTFPSPQTTIGESTPEFLRALRTRARPDRWTMVLGQYSPTKPPAWDCAFAEDAVNLVLADLPLTVICVCERSGAVEHQALTTRSHATLLRGGRRVSNPDYRPPAGSRPAPLAPWGDPLLATTVRGSDDLAAVRRRVDDVAAAAGLRGDARGAAVLAVHEAVLLAGGAGLGEVPGPCVGEQEVRVRVGGGAMVTEVLAPAGTAVAGDGDGDDNALCGSDLRRASLPAFCDQLAVHDGPDGRLVRVLTACGPSTTQRPVYKVRHAPRGG